MIARPLLAATALLSIVAAGAAAQDSTEGVAEPLEQTASEAVPTSTDSDAERKICHTEKVTGSLSRRNRICLTAAQWREIHNRTRRGVDEMNSAASGGKECVLDANGGCRVSIN
jgi:hypothetical protein